MSKPLPRCRHSYQVDVSSKVNVRTGPGTSYAIAGSIPNGGLAAVVCQKKGSKVGTARLIDAADVPIKPVRPNRMLVTGVSVEIGRAHV